VILGRGMDKSAKEKFDFNDKVIYVGEAVG
jgi:hypothetical protein